MSQKEIISKVTNYRQRLIVFINQSDKEREILHVLHKLNKVDMSLDVLKSTGIGLTVNKLKAFKNETVASAATTLVSSWKAVVSMACGSSNNQGAAVKRKAHEGKRPNDETKKLKHSHESNPSSSNPSSSSPNPSSSSPNPSSSSPNTSSSLLSKPSSRKTTKNSSNSINLATASNSSLKSTLKSISKPMTLIKTSTPLALTAASYKTSSSSVETCKPPSPYIPSSITSKSLSSSVSSLKPSSSNSKTKSTEKTNEIDTSYIPSKIINKNISNKKLNSTKIEHTDDKQDSKKQFKNSQNTLNKAVGLGIAKTTKHNTKSFIGTSKETSSLESAIENLSKDSLFNQRETKFNKDKINSGKSKHTSNLKRPNKSKVDNNQVMVDNNSNKKDDGDDFYRDAEDGSDDDDGISNQTGLSFSDLMAYKPSKNFKRSPMKDAKSNTKKHKTKHTLKSTGKNDRNNNLNADKQNSSLLKADPFYIDLPELVQTSEYNPSQAKVGLQNMYQDLLANGNMCQEYMGQEKLGQEEKDQEEEGVEDISGGLRRYAERKVYSGRKKSQYVTSVSSLIECCQHVLHDNFDAIEDVGYTPCILLDPILSKVSLSQLQNFEVYNEHLLDETDKYWEKHIRLKFPQGVVDEGGEGWRALYRVLVAQREDKLSRATENIMSKINKNKQGARTARQTLPEQRRRGHRTVTIVPQFRATTPSTKPKSQFMKKLMSDLKKRR